MMQSLYCFHTLAEVGRFRGNSERLIFKPRTVLTGFKNHETSRKRNTLAPTLKSSNPEVLRWGMSLEICFNALCANACQLDAVHDESPRQKNLCAGATLSCEHTMRPCHKADTQNPKPDSQAFELP